MYNPISSLGGAGPSAAAYAKAGPSGPSATAYPKAGPSSSSQREAQVGIKRQRDEEDVRELTGQQVEGVIYRLSGMMRDQFNQAIKEHRLYACNNVQMTPVSAYHPFFTEVPFMIQEQEAYITEEEGKSVSLTKKDFEPNPSKEPLFFKSDVTGEDCIRKGALFAVAEGDEDIKSIVSEEFERIFFENLSKQSYIQRGVPFVFNKTFTEMHKIVNVRIQVPPDEVKRCMAVFCYIDTKSHIVYTATWGGCEANLYKKINERWKSVPLSYFGKSVYDGPRKVLQDPFKKYRDRIQRIKALQDNGQLNEEGIEQSGGAPMGTLPYWVNSLTDLRAFKLQEKNSSFFYHAFEKEESHLCDPFITAVRIETGDRLVLCSYYIKNGVPEEKIVDLFAKSEGPVQVTAATLEECAKAMGVPNSISAIVIEITQESQAIEPSPVVLDGAKSLAEMIENLEKAIDEHREKARDKTKIFFKTGVASWRPREKKVYVEKTTPGVLQPISPYEEPQVYLQLKTDVASQARRISSVAPRLTIPQTADAYFIESRPRGILLGVLDGHGEMGVSSEVSSKVAKLFPDIFFQTLDRYYNDIKYVFEKSFRLMQDQTTHYRAGSTAVFCFVDIYRALVYTATLGDSEANIYRVIQYNNKSKMRSIPLSCVRDWSHPKEIARAEKFKMAIKEPTIAQPARNLGESALKPRVGKLNVSRGFGDSSYPYISKKPVITVIRVNPGDVIVLCSDGITDYVPANEIAAICQGSLQLSKEWKEVMSFYQSQQNRFSTFDQNTAERKNKPREVQEDLKKLHEKDLAELKKGKFQFHDLFEGYLIDIHQRQVRYTQSILDDQLSGLTYPCIDPQKSIAQEILDHAVRERGSLDDVTVISAYVDIPM